MNHIYARQVHSAHQAFGGKIKKQAKRKKEKKKNCRLKRVLVAEYDKMLTSLEDTSVLIY